MPAPSSLLPIQVRIRALSLYGFTTLMAVVTVAVMANDARLGNWSFVALETIGLLTIPILLLLIRAKQQAAAGWLALSALWGVATAISVTGLGVMGNAVLYLIALPTMAGLLLGIRGSICWSAVSLVTLLSLTIFHQPDPADVVLMRTTTDALDRVIDLLSLLLLLGVATSGLLWVQTRVLEQMQDALEAAREAQQAQARFLATMSHEIRTPINGVIGAAHLLEGTALREEQRALLQVIDTSAGLLLDLINDILDYSRLESSALTLEYLPVLLADLSEEVLASLRLQAAAKGILLECELAPSLPPCISADPTRLRQILINLLGNAVKFTSEGEVRLRLSAVSGAQPPAWQIQVSDTGIGISPEALQHLFQPFAQADASTTRRFGGTGLGLAIVQRIVAQMGGTIQVGSIPGAGSTFTVTLPLHLASPPEQLPSEAPQPTTAHPAGRSVLLVDDHPINRLIARQQLQQQGHTVREARDGHEAVALAGAGGWDVVLMDCQMPVMDGYEATRQIRTLPGPLGQVPIVGLSANAMHGDRERALDAGMDDYLTKPVRPEDLMHAIARLSASPDRAEVEA